MAAMESVGELHIDKEMAGPTLYLYTKRNPNPINYWLCTKAGTD